MSRDSDDRAIEAFREHAGLMQTKDALDLGIHPRTLYRLRDEGIVVQVSRGIYRLASLPPLSQPDIAAVALR
ncbi:MAG: type IV toxin-antitoxin system AbiEi family antitoxin domain-containing protein, partial [Deltaproteobacteria bacterium]|nr:type IV toxin-antitoxin system AbiEi family antitoxin domain-containing protein [Deltaproteobacteria bacterium]